MKIWKDAGSGYFCFLWSDGATFLVEERGRELWAQLPANLREEDIIPVYLSGHMMSFILRLRGYVCLHASAVAVDGKAILIGGQQGAGKSTLAAAFARRGYAILTDDVVALKESRGDLFVYPSFPRIGLWPESAQGLFGPGEDLPRLWSHEEKRYLQLEGRYRFSAGPVKLGAVYILGDRLPPGAPPRIEPAAGPPAIIALVANTFGVLRPEHNSRAAEFRLLARAAQRPVRRVDRAPDLARIDELCDAILRDYQSFQRKKTRPPKPIPITAHGKKPNPSAIHSLR